MYREKRAQWRVFFLAFILTLSALALIMVGTVMAVQPSMPQGQQNPAPAEDSYRPQPGDSLTLAVIGVGNGKPTDILLIRFNPQYGQVPLSLLPPETAVTLDGESMTLEDAYRKGGGGAVRRALAERLDIVVDRYAALSRDMFLRISEKAGTVAFEMPYAVAYSRDGYDINIPAGERRLDGQDVADLYAAPFFEADRIEKSKVLGALTAAVVNQNLGIAGSDVSSAMFKMAVNLIDTDVTSTDYEMRREAADFISKLNAQISGSFPISGSYQNEGTVLQLSDDYVAVIRQYFQAAS